MSDALDRFAAFINRLAPKEPQPERGTQAATREPAPELMAGDHDLSSAAPTSTEVARPARLPIAALKMHRDINWTIDKREVAEWLCRFLEATSQPRNRSEGADRLAVGPVAPKVERDAKPPRPPEAQARAVIMPDDVGGEPTASKHPVSTADNGAAQARMAAGLPLAARRCPPSWSNPAAPPSPRSFCSCCRGQRWWREREAPKGWRCSNCHPPAHLPPNAIYEKL